MKYLTLDPTDVQPPTRDDPDAEHLPSSLPDANKTLQHPRDPGEENASIFFVGTATTVLYAQLPISHIRSPLMGEIESGKESAS